MSHDTISGMVESHAVAFLTAVKWLPRLVDFPLQDIHVDIRNLPGDSDKNSIWKRIEFIFTNIVTGKSQSITVTVEQFTSNNPVESPWIPTYLETHVGGRVPLQVSMNDYVVDVSDDPELVRFSASLLEDELQSKIVDAVYKTVDYVKEDSSVVRPNQWEMLKKYAAVGKWRFVDIPNFIQDQLATILVEIDTGGSKARLEFEIDFESVAMIPKSIVYEFHGQDEPKIFHYENRAFEGWKFYLVFPGDMHVPVFVGKYANWHLIQDLKDKLINGEEIDKYAEVSQDSGNESAIESHMLVDEFNAF